MNGTLPNSPFATRFSGREGETHLRITNIAKGQHRRPAFVILALVLLVILSCGWFFSFGAKARGLTVVMETQYYDSQGNCIEIPAVAPAGGGEAPGAAALNQALDDLRSQYRLVLGGTLSGPAGLENCCLFYLTQTDRYYNFLFYRDEFRTDLSCGHVTALVYDRRKDALVTLADALTLAGQTEDGLCQALADQYDPQLKQENPAADLCIQNQQVEGFRMGADGKVLFYLTARIDDRDDSVQDAVSGGDHLYIWSSGVFTQYDEEQPLVPEEECAAFDPPLYWQRQKERGGTLTEEERTLIRDYYAASYDQVYLPGEDGTWTSDQYGLRLTDIQYMGSTPLYETEGVVFRVVKQTQPDGQPDSEHPYYIVLQRNAAGSYYGVLGECPAYALHPGRAALTPEQAALQVCYKLDDLEVSLWRDVYPGGVGPGASLTFSCLDTGHIETTQRPDLEPIYQPGDYWCQADGQRPTGSFTAQCYHSAADNRDVIRSLRTDMTDLSTYRGVRVGDSREQVQDLYPEAHSGDFWGLYPDEDYLWYSAWDGDLAYGPAILFFFDGQGKVESFELMNMVD